MTRGNSEIARGIKKKGSPEETIIEDFLKRGRNRSSKAILLLKTTGECPPNTTLCAKKLRGGGGGRDGELHSVEEQLEKGERDLLQGTLPCRRWLETRKRGEGRKKMEEETPYRKQWE